MFIPIRLFTSELMKKSDNKDFYQKNWQLIVKLLKVDRTHCIHHGYYEKGIRTHLQAVNNLNNLVDSLLGLKKDKTKTKKILDAGCGIGGTVVYLAEKYPTAKFTGITKVPEHIKLAKNYAEEKQVIANTDFISKDFTNTSFSNNQFEVVYLVESSCYAPDKQILIKEMQRILKPNGTLIIIDIFLTNIKQNYFIKNIYKWFCKGWGLPNLIKLEEFKDSLKTEGFHEITERDLTKNITRTIFRGDIQSIPYLIPIIIKKIFLGKRYKITKDLKFIGIVPILATLLGIKKAMTYNVITAFK